MIALIGISIVERLRDRGFDSCICFDDLSKHSKCYRQISLILAKIPSRDAFPADIFNIHSSLLERCGKLMYSYFGGSITAFPVIETINSDITEYIATNVISITDGQFYTNKRLFLDSCRPAIDSGLSVSRIGSSAQSKLMKVLSVGIKNLLTNYRIMELSSHSSSSSTSNASLKLLSLNISFYQDHLLISPIETSLILLLFFRNAFLFNSLIQIHRLLFLLSFEYLYLYYILFLLKTSYDLYLYSLFMVCIKSIILLIYTLVCFRVLGLKLLPPLINLLFFPPFSLLFVFGSLVLVSEDYFNRIVDLTLRSLFLVFGLKTLKVPLLVLLSFFFINTGTTASLVSIKAFLSVSMIVGNFIDVYLFGLIAVLMN